jgi:hypothetical protein
MFAGDKILFFIKKQYQRIEPFYLKGLNAAVKLSQYLIGLLH